MKIAPGDVIDEKIVVEVSSAQRCFCGIVRSVRFEDGSYGIICIEGGAARVTDFNDLNLKKALSESQEMPILEADCGGERLWVKGQDLHDRFGLQIIAG